MMFYNLNRFDEHRLNYPAYSFAHILVNNFNLNSYQKERLLYIANEIWDDKMHLFNVTKYENLLLGIMTYVLAETEADIVDVSTYVKDLFGEDSNRDIIQVYNIYQIITDLFSQRLDNSGLCAPQTGWGTPEVALSSACESSHNADSLCV
jgi:hypothetical protein